MEVFVIQHIKKGEIVAVIESKVSADLTLKHWLVLWSHRVCGYPVSLHSAAGHHVVKS